MFQHILTKVEVKELIKERLIPITNIFKVKDNTSVNVETNRENIYKIITKPLNLCKQTKQQHQGWETCILELLDRRITVSCTQRDTLTQHKNKLYKVIILTYIRFASCLDNNKVKPYSSESYEQIHSPLI